MGACRGYIVYNVNKEEIDIEKFDIYMTENFMKIDKTINATDKDGYFKLREGLSEFKVKQLETILRECEYLTDYRIFYMDLTQGIEFERSKKTYPYLELGDTLFKFVNNLETSKTVCKQLFSGDFDNAFEFLTGEYYLMDKEYNLNKGKNEIIYRLSNIGLMCYNKPVHNKIMDYDISSYQLTEATVRRCYGISLTDMLDSFKIPYSEVIYNEGIYFIKSGEVEVNKYCRVVNGAEMTVCRAENSDRMSYF